MPALPCVADLVAETMSGQAPAAPGRVARFYENNAAYIRYGVAVTEVIVVPLLVFNAIGQIQLEEPLKSWVIVPLALIETMSIAALLVAGYQSPKATATPCRWCGGPIVAEVSAWVCQSCHHRDERGQHDVRPTDSPTPNS